MHVPTRNERLGASNVKSPALKRAARYRVLRERNVDDGVYASTAGYRGENRANHSGGKSPHHTDFERESLRTPSQRKKQRKSSKKPRDVQSELDHLARNVYLIYAIGDIHTV